MKIHEVLARTATLQQFYLMKMLLWGENFQKENL